VYIHNPYRSRHWFDEYVTFPTFPQWITSHHMVTDLSHYMTAETVESRHRASDLSHHGGGCPRPSDSTRHMTRRPLALIKDGGICVESSNRVTESHGDISHHGGTCRVESSHITSHGDLSYHGGNCRVESHHMVTSRIMAETVE